MNPTHFIIHTIQCKPGVIDEAKTLFEELVPRLAERFDAWRGARLTACRDTNQIVTIGAWTDAEQMKAFLEQPAFGETMASFAKLFAAPPQTTITEIVTQVGPAH